LRKGEAGYRDWPVEPVPAKRREQALTCIPPSPVGDELPYLTILNGCLPHDIRILSWSPVHENFDARFSCIWRRYRYYFPKGSLDIEKMQEAAALFIGGHDFMNFCKIGILLISTN
jgi:tRNA U38,U39,U40 pseudouridine synthase TruA